MNNTVNERMFVCATNAVCIIKRQTAVAMKRIRQRGNHVGRLHICDGVFVLKDRLGALLWRS